MFKVPDTTKPDVEESFINMSAFEKLEAGDPDMWSSVKHVGKERTCPECGEKLRFDPNISKIQPEIEMVEIKEPGAAPKHKGAWVCDKCGWR